MFTASREPRAREGGPGQGGEAPRGDRGCLAAGPAPPPVTLVFLPQVQTSLTSTLGEEGQGPWGGLGSYREGEDAPSRDLLPSARNPSCSSCRFLPVHQTSLKSDQHLVSSDNKGFAALRLERELNPEGTHPGQVRGGAAGPSRDRKGGDTAR